jgi:fibronectin type 3 domain-containing protein
MIRLSVVLLALSAVGFAQHRARLVWTSSDQVVSYRVHRATKAAGPFTKIASGIKVLTYVDRSVAAGQTYYYKVDARNPVTDLVSPYSATVKAEIP